MEKANELPAKPPRIQKIDVPASKLPPVALAEPTMKTVLLTFAAKEDSVPEVKLFLRDAQPLVMEELETPAWFAVHSDRFRKSL